MHTIHLLLSIYVHILCGLIHNVTAEAVPSTQLLPEGFSAFGNYEILSIYEEEDEDIVRIRKRTEQENCLSDCIDYSGWTENRLMPCGIEDIDAEDVSNKRSMVKRGRKKSKACVRIST
jgi:hypothetical protein